MIIDKSVAGSWNQQSLIDMSELDKSICACFFISCNSKQYDTHVYFRRETEINKWKG